MYLPNLPLNNKKKFNLENHYAVVEDLYLHHAEPHRRPPAKSLVDTATAVLHEVPSVMINSERDLTPFSGSAGTKISCTVCVLKIALGTSRPAVLLINIREECHPFKLTMNLHQMMEKLEIILHRGI